MNRLLSIATVGLLLSSAALAQDVSAKRESAEQAAQAWLAVVDRGDYGQSWQQAASFFQLKISQAGWVQALNQVRAPLGTAGNRTLMGSMYKTDLPSAPKGEYVVIQFKTEFANMGPAIETITPMLDKDGHWRVSGYFIKTAK